MAGTHEFDHYKQDQFIYFPDEPSEYIYMIAQGRVRIGHYSAEGKEIITSILTVGEIFGELAIAGEDKRKDFAQSMDGDTKICKLSIQELKALM